MHHDHPASSSSQSTHRKPFICRKLWRGAAPFVVPVLCVALTGCDQGGGLNAVAASQKDYKDLLAESEKKTHEQIQQFGTQLQQTNDRITGLQNDQAKKIDELSQRLREISTGVQPLAQKVLALETVQTDLMAAVGKQDALNKKVEQLQKILDDNKGKLGEHEAELVKTMGEIKDLLKQVSDDLAKAGKTLRENPAPSKQSSPNNNSIVGMIGAAALAFAGCPAPVAIALGAILGGIGSSTSVQMSYEDASEILDVANRYKNGEEISAADWQKVLDILKKSPQFRDLSDYDKQILEQYLGGKFHVAPWSQPSIPNPNGKVQPPDPTPSGQVQVPK